MIPAAFTRVRLDLVEFVRRSGSALCVSLFIAVSLSTATRGFSAGAVLTHRYPFDTNADDVIGGANGILTNGAIVSNGAAIFDGAFSRVQLPADMFTNYDSLSFEVWYVEQGVTLGTPALYAFANCCSTNVGLFGYSSGAAGYNAVVVTPSPPIMDTTNHFVWTQDSNSHTACIYLNGLLAAKSTNLSLTPATVGPTPNAWLGWRGITPPLALRGQILEFRSYSNALTDMEVAINNAAGPDLPGVTPGNLQGVRLALRTNSGPGAMLSISAVADFQNVSNVNILGQPDISLSSDNTNVAVAVGNSKVKTISYGSANITLQYLGFSNTVPLTVSVPQGFVLAHRYSFSESLPNNVPHDSVGAAHARLTGVSMTNGQAKMSGSGYVDLPDGMISSLSEVSLEAWITPTNNGFYPRIFDFGSQYRFNGVGQVRGLTYIYMTHSGNSSDAVVAAISANDISGELPRRLNRSGTLPLNVQSHVAMTISPIQNSMKLYVNGVPVDSTGATVPLSSVDDTNCWLGRSQFEADSFYRGLFNEFRIYEGFLTDADIAADYAAGPDVVGVDYSLFSSNSGPNLTLSWRPAMAGWILKSSPELAPAANWTEVGLTPDFQNGRYSVTVQMTNAPLYFRLFKP